MNPLAAIRDLLGDATEGKTMQLLGPDYRLRRQKEAVEIQRILAAIEGDKADRAMRAEENTRQGRKDSNTLAMDTLKFRGQNEDRPTVPVSEAAGGVGPPAPGPDLTGTVVDPMTGAPQTIHGTYRNDDMARMLAELEAKGGVENRTALARADAADALPAHIGARSRSVLGVGDEPVTGNDVTILNAEKARQAALAAANTRHSGGLTSHLSDEYVRDVAERYAAGEYTAEQARGMLGGVKGMQEGNGERFSTALADRRGMTPALRKDLASVTTTRNIVDKMEELVNGIINSKTPEERAENTILLEQFGQTTGTLLSRGFGERGVVTDKDVSRATGLVPGWKAANFNPAYARREIALLRDVLDRNEKGVLGAATQQYDRSGGRVNGAGDGAPKPTHRFNPATGRIESIQ